MENQTHVPNRPKSIRGEPCSLAEFRDRYKLSDDEAIRLYEKFGPSVVELDIIMKAKSANRTW